MKIKKNVSDASIAGDYWCGEDAISILMNSKNGSLCDESYLELITGNSRLSIYQKYNK